MKHLAVVVGFAILALGCLTVQGQNNFPPNFIPPYCGSTKGWGAIPAPSWPNPSNPPTLKLVQTVIRHGDRAPVSYAPCWNNEDEWKCSLYSQEHPGYDKDQGAVHRVYSKRYLKNHNYHPGDCSVGQLTNTGYLQEIANGRTLRQYYVDQAGFLPHNLDTSAIYVHSDDISRTFTSAESLMLALYPADTKGTQVIDIWTEDGGFEYFYGNYGLCPILQQYESAFYKSPKWLDHVKKVRQPLLHELGKALNVSASSIDLDDLYDCLQASLCHLHSIPSGITFDLYNRVVAEATYAEHQLYNYPDPVSYGQACMGFLFADIYQHMVNSISKADPLKFVLYSGHDTTIMPLLNAMQAWDGVWAPYASYLTFELYQDNAGANYVRLIHNSQEVVLPGCGQAIFSWAQFKAVITPLSISNPASQCKAKSMH
jgi:hypothetical protein